MFCLDPIFRIFAVVTDFKKEEMMVRFLVFLFSPLRLWFR